jgi:NTP pyrophosphatase (non-canonical NTP hydrolase)
MTLQENLNRLRDESHRLMVANGFTDADVLEDLMLMVSEASEALEDHRANHAPNEVWYEEKSYGMKPCGVPSEIADVVLRVLHFSGKHDIDIERAVAELEAYWKATGHAFEEKTSITRELFRLSASFYEALLDYDRGRAPNAIVYEANVTDPLSPSHGPMGIPIRMASAILHAAHFADKHGFDLLAAVEEKHAFNMKRPFKHGNKAI